MSKICVSITLVRNEETGTEATRIEHNSGMSTLEVIGLLEVAKATLLIQANKTATELISAKLFGDRDPSQ